MADLIRSAKPLRGAKYVCMEGADKLVSSVIMKSLDNSTDCDIA